MKNIYNKIRIFQYFYVDGTDSIFTLKKKINFSYNVCKFYIVNCRRY